MSRTTRNRNWKWFRRMRTTAERRANHSFVVDAKEENWNITNREKKKGNLDSREIPTAWIDTPTASEYDKYRYKNNRKGRL